MKTTLCVSGALAAATLVLLPIEQPNAQQVRLIFASQSPAGTPNTVFYSNWANRVSEQSNGKLKIEVRDGETLANFITAYDRVSDDVVQIGWIIHSLVSVVRRERTAISGGEQCGLLGSVVAALQK